MGVIAVGRDGKTPLMMPYGLASVELDVPHQATDVFMIGSMSKQFTAVAILLLEQDGKLSTADAVGKYLPGFASGDRGRITIEQLLTHTSGVPDVYSLKRFGETGGQGGAFAEVIADLSVAELTFPPGSGYAYSNGGYAVLAAVIERVSGMPYGKFLDQRIFKPLGLHDTSHGGAGPAIRHRVPGYDPWGRDRLAPAMAPTAAYLTGSGSIWSSAADLLTWTSALHNGRVLSNAAYRKLIHNYGHEYGYGLSVFHRFGRQVIGHDGRVAGYASDVARYVDDHVTIVVLSNVQSVARDEIRQLVGAAALGQPYSVPARRMFVDRPSDSLLALAGVYSFGSDFTVSIDVQDGRLLARANEGGYSELVPVSDNEWFSRMLYSTVHFARDESGSIDRLVWGRGDGAPVGRRIR